MSTLNINFAIICSAFILTLALVLLCCDIARSIEADGIDINGYAVAQVLGIERRRSSLLLVNQVIASSAVRVVIAFDGARAQPVHVDHLLLLG